MWREGGLYKQVCDSGEFVGKEGEGEREGEREMGREGWERDMEMGGDSGRGRILWVLGGNLYLAFEGWVSYNHSFVTSQKGIR